MTLAVTVVAPGDLGATEVERWRSFQARSALTQSPFLSPTFARIVGRHRRGARVAVLEVDGRLEGFWAFEGVGGIARPIGWPANDLQGVVHSGVELDGRAIVRRAGLRGWRFDHALADDGVLVAHRYAHTAVECPVIETGDFDDYLERRPRSVRREFGRTRRGLERAVGPLAFHWAGGDAAAFETLVRWKGDRYAATRRLFEDAETSRFIAEAAASDEPDCRGAISTLWAGAELVAVDLKLEGPVGSVGWFSGFDPRFSRFSPGVMILLEGVRWASRRGRRAWVDLGYGQHNYKFALATTSYPVAGGAVWARRSEAVARAAFRGVRSAASRVGTASSAGGRRTRRREVHDRDT